MQQTNTNLLESLDNYKNVLQPKKPRGRPRLGKNDECGSTVPTGTVKRAVTSTQSHVIPLGNRKDSLIIKTTLNND